MVEAVLKQIARLCRAVTAIRHENVFNSDHHPAAWLAQPSDRAANRFQIIRNLVPLALGAILLSACTDLHQEYGADSNWRVYQGDKQGSQYSQLDQISRANVAQLQPVWTYHTQDETESSQMQCNPLIIEGVLYGTSPQLKVFALDAATGEEKWVFDPFPEEENHPAGVNRGLTWWEDASEQRILFSAGEFLYALDANTGKLIPSFGQQGRTSLKKGLSRAVDDYFVIATSPGVVYQDLIIMGTRVSEGTNAAPGDIRAFDVKTGEVRWVFHTIPLPGEKGYDTWPADAYKTVGGANAWGGMSVDEQRGMVFVPTGSASFDFYGGNRQGQNLFANCLLALDAASGKLIWYFQAVHHDLWDRDLPTVPNLVTVEHEGNMVDGVAQVTKHGFVFLFNRETGEPLFPIEEQPVPPSDIMGEEAWPTQPVPVRPPPFTRQVFEPTSLSSTAHQYIRDSLKNLKIGSLFTPPSLEGTLLLPGYDGGADWGGAAFDPETGWLYVNANEMPWLLQLMKIAPEQDLTASGKNLYLTNCAVCHGADQKGDPTANYPSLTHIGDKLSNQDIRRMIQYGRGFMPSFKHLAKEDQEALVAFLTNREMDKESESFKKEVTSEDNHALPYVHTGYKRLVDEEGYPAIKPPWGTLSAIDLNQGEIVWQVPLGEIKALTERGIPITGTESYGGPIMTAGGLLLIAATKDEKIRAFDKQTGQILWEATLPAGGYATPSTYTVDGKQYVVIACGGGKLGTPSGDAYVAFALPD